MVRIDGKLSATYHERRGSIWDTISFRCSDSMAW